MCWFKHDWKEVRTIETIRMTARFFGFPDNYTINGLIRLTQCKACGKKRAVFHSPTVSFKVSVGFWWDRTRSYL